MSKSSLWLIDISIIQVVGAAMANSGGDLTASHTLFQLMNFSSLCQPGTWI
ncbi:hypothetical protein [Escherichia coli]|uniref:hypothetical protein n=1 Tax=Escherichia coli TaxID=562 RepID=UPI003F490568